MSILWTPAKAEARIRQEAATLGEAIRVIEFSRRLKAFDERMDIWPCTETDPEGDVRVGFWYLVRYNEDGTTAMWELSDGDRPREPNEGDIQMLREKDLRNPQVQREMADRKRRAAAEKARADERAAEDRMGMALERLTYLTRVQVPVSKDVS